MLLGVAVLCAGQAWAHGGGPGLGYDPCAKRVGMYYVHMAAYQPRLDPFKEYCGQIPGAGDTLFVFDLVGAEMRRTPVAVEIVDAGGRSGRYQVAAAPPKEYPSGVIDIGLKLRAGHSYTALVTVGESPASYTVEFPVSVESWWSGLAPLAALIIVVLAAAAAYCLRQRKELRVMLRKAELRPRIRAVS